MQKHLKTKKMNKKEFCKVLLSKLDDKMSKEGLNLYNIGLSPEKYPVSRKTIYNIRDFVDKDKPISEPSIKALADMVEVEYITDYIMVKS